MYSLFDASYYSTEGGSEVVGGGGGVTSGGQDPSYWSTHKLHTETSHMALGA